MEASVNFGAAKLTVYGDTTIEEIERAGAFENIKVFPEKQKIEEEKVPFLQKHSTVIVSIVFLLIGWMAAQLNSEESISSILAYGAAILIGGYRLFTTGIKNLIRFEFDMKTLMTIAVIGAAFIGEWGEGATVVILFAISEALESYSMDKARQSIRSLMDIAPKEAIIRRGNHEFTVEVDDILIGDIMIVKPGQKIAMDGIIVKGLSAVNQASITGESVPVAKTVADEVFAGTLNEEGLLEVRVTKHVDDTTIAKIIHLVEEAQAERAPSQAFVDRFAKYYTPVIMLVALGVAVIPPLFFGADWDKWIYQGLAALVVGCPCALVISTPVAIVTAIGNAARNGVLIKGGIHLEEMGAIKAIAFDKTGTLTEGVPVVTDFLPMKKTNSHELFAIIAALEHGSQHPLASAIVKKAVHENIRYKELEITDFMSITGKGIKGKVYNKIYYVGSPLLFEELLPYGIPADLRMIISDYQNKGKTVMVAGTDTEILGLLAVADGVRGNSKSVIQKLQILGIQETIMLTGDNKGTARAIGNQVGISTIKAELLPQDKLAFIKELRRKYDKVAMVGDGANDAPALAAATVGIAMGGAGTDTALETADIALMADDLSKLPFTLKLSRKALTIIKQNITFSLGIKLVALLLVIPGWLTLWIAIFADMGATLIVTLNGLRLLKIKEKKKGI
ncbi:Cd2+/Zn2+-exporting ATPase [Bacillus sp. OK048]|nr:Cd2+/Zn2+-exporting ATPase [Bacillus sp. OK048]